jgi:hypothetical protein
MQEGLMITGQVGLVRKSRHPVSRIIEWVTRCDTSHVIIATSEVQCISAEPGGTRRRLISDYPRITWSQYVLTDRQAHLIAGIAEYTIGVRYDYLACTAHAIAAITHIDTPPAAQRWLANRAPTTCPHTMAPHTQRLGLVLRNPRVEPHLNHRRAHPGGASWRPNDNQHSPTLTNSTFAKPTGVVNPTGTSQRTSTGPNPR